MADVNPTLSVITLNVNGLNTPIKRHRLLKLIKKHDPTFTRHNLDSKKHIKSKKMKNIYYANSNQKRGEVPILISDK